MKDLLYFLMFMFLMLGTFVGFYLLEPVILYVIIGFLVLSGLRHAFKWRNWLTKWADQFMTSIDQTWQVLFSPLLNLGVTTKHVFGYPDETASSVVGKNLRDTNLLRWRMIEKVVTILEGGKPHSIPSIEEDEGAK